MGGLGSVHKKHMLYLLPGAAHGLSLYDMVVEQLLDLVYRGQDSRSRRAVLLRLEHESVPLLLHHVHAVLEGVLLRRRNTCLPDQTNNKQRDTNRQPFTLTNPCKAEPPVWESDCLGIVWDNVSSSKRADVSNTSPPQSRSDNEFLTSRVRYVCVMQLLHKISY